MMALPYTLEAPNQATMQAFQRGEALNEKSNQLEAWGEVVLIRDGGQIAH